jgi:uncharacterized membrane protein
MNKNGKIITGFLFTASYIGLFIIWSTVINSLLVPWDGTLPQDRPPSGTISGSVNEYFETSVGLYLILAILFAISLSIMALRIKKTGTAKTYQILEHTAISNLLYMGLLITLFALYAWIAPFKQDVGYSWFGIIMIIAGIIGLFAVQFTGYTLDKKNSPIET